MYDKNRIEDSLEFVRQMKEFLDSDDDLDEFDPFEDNDSDELFVNLAYHMEPELPQKESATQASSAMGDSFGVPDTGVIQEQRRLAEERLRLEEEAARRRQAEQEQQKRLAEERQRLEEEAARRRQAELEQQKRLEEERQRLEKEAARRRQAEQEQQRKLEEERQRLEEEKKRRRQAELQEKQRQEAERKKIEEERKRLAEEQRKQEEARQQLEEERRRAQEEAKRQLEEERRRAQEEARRQLEEERRRAQEEAKRREAEQQKRLKEEQLRAQEEAKRKAAELAEQKRLAEEKQRKEEEAKRRQAELLEKQRQEAERQKIEAERKRLAQEQKRQEEARRQLEKERQRMVEEQLQRELEEQRRILAEQAKKKAEEKAKQEAAEKERRRKLIQEEEQRKKELQAREEEQRKKEEEERKKKEQLGAAAKQNAGMPDPIISTASNPESEVELLRKRAEELKRQAEMATLEARMRQLQLEAEGISTGESVMVPPPDTAVGRENKMALNGANPLAANSVASSAAGANNSMPMPMLSIPGVQAQAGGGQQTGSGVQNNKDKPKLSKEEIDSIFAKELKKASSDSSYQQRKMMLQKQSERLKRKRAENGDKLPLEIVKEKAVQIKDFTIGTALAVREFALDKMTDPENAESREKAKKIMSNILVILICIAVALLVSSIVTNFIAHPTKVEGESMETTLTDGDTVIIQKLSYYFGDPDRYDVIVFPIYNSETYYIKRVIGLPGETVQIKEGKVYINDKELSDDIYGKDEFINDPGDAGEPITLASDEYFVLGDNRNMSTDSRSSYVGPVKKRKITGKAWRRILPFSKNGKVK